MLRPRMDMSQVKLNMQQSYLAGSGILFYCVSLLLALVAVSTRIFGVVILPRMSILQVVLYDERNEIGVQI